MQTTKQPITHWQLFDTLQDPREDGRNKRHLFKEILVLTIVGFACGMKSFEAVAEFCEMQESWFRKFLSLPNGIPSHDTFRRVFELLDSKAFEQCFMLWTKQLCEDFPGDVVAIDGKTIRNSGTASTRAMHLVSAWSHANGLVLGQVQTEEKSNEITAIPELLSALCIKGCIVTTDAMGCQKSIAERIIDQKADYILAVKDNHPTLHDELKLLFSSVLTGGLKDIPVSFHEESDKGHGRIETRKCWTTSFVKWFEEQEQWKGLRSFTRIDDERTVNGKTSMESRYFISSLDGKNAEQVLKSVRSHWEVENKLHWCLDVTMGEDQACLRERKLAINAAIARRLAMNALRKHPSYKKSLAKAIRSAAFNLQFRETLLKSITSNA